MLRKFRIVVSVVIFALITFLFLNFSETKPVFLYKLASIQLIPALLALNFWIISAIVIITFLFGRIYCSTVCPLGVFQDVINFISKRYNRKKRFRFTKEMRVLRWTIAVVATAALIFGFTFLLGLLDPYAAFGRISSHLFRPVYLAGNNLLALIFTSLKNYTFYKVAVYISSIFSFIIALVTLAVIGYMSWTNGRLYCNTICPAGTVLGFISRFSLFRIRIDESSCNSCGSCGRKCKASCIDTKNHKIDYSRCIGCFDCMSACPEKSINFTLPDNKNAEIHPIRVDSSKRNFMLLLGATGLTGTKLLPPDIAAISTKDIGRTKPVTPPGSLNRENFLTKCTACHLCISNCPSNVLKPAFFEYGLGGMMQPTLYYDRGFCNYDCTVCTDECPSGALLPLTTDQKHTNQMGQVHFVKENCVVYTKETNCGACSEHCPTQAVTMIPYKGALTIPEIDSTICCGCGGCEHICPVKPYKAIFVEGIDVHKKIKIKKEKKEEIKVEDFGF